MFKHIDIKQAKELIDNTDLTIFDVRNKQVYDQAHIQNALHLTQNNFADMCQTLDKTKPVLVYCYHGISSQAMANFIAQQGFKEVYNLDGGYNAWQEQAGEEHNG